MNRLVFEVGYLIGLARIAWHSETPAAVLVEAKRAGLLKPGQRVLDVGCGLGTNTAWLAQNGLDVTAIDLSGVAVAQLRRRLRKKGLHAKVFRADLLKGLNEPAFDVVFDRATLHSFAEPAQREAFARELAKLVRPGGLLLLSELRPVARLAHRTLPPFGLDASDLRALFAPAFEIQAVGEEIQRHIGLGDLPFTQWQLTRSA
jgi:2-polyprenyl-3-methyl-5-hydroxy-6-metoxy-1,4-benzoquinol methylase